MLCVFRTLDTSHINVLETKAGAPLLNEVALKNVSRIFVTLLVSKLSKFLLNAIAPINVARIFVTLLVSQLFNS